MTGIPNLVAQALQGDALRRLARSIGAPEAQTRDAAMAALPVMLGQMQRNASTPGGAQALNAALERDHAGGGLLDNLGPLLGMLGGGAAAGGLGGALAGALGGGQQGGGGLGGALGGMLGGGNTRQLNGGGILGHIFGGREEQVGTGVAQASGMDKGQVLRLMMMLAPLVMSALARRKQEANAGPAELPEVLGGATAEAREQAPGGLMGALRGLLDGDGR